MLLYCAICGKPWRRVRDADRKPVSCTRCRRQHLANVQCGVWKRRRIASAARTEAIPPGPPPTPDQLLELMGEADSKAARALELARTITARFRS